MNRRGLGRGRLLVGLGALVMLVGCFLPWYTIGGAALPALSSNAFEGAGIVVFLAAVALLALLALPYASGGGRVALDRPLAFAVVASAGAAGLALRVVQMASQGLLRVDTALPDRALGLWLAAVGTAITMWGVAEITGERPPAY